jgi:hypothetical protein
VIFILCTSLRNCTDDLFHFCNPSFDDPSPLTGITPVGDVDSRGWIGRNGCGRRVKGFRGGCARWACLQRIHNNMVMAGRLEGEVEGTATSVGARERTGSCPEGIAVGFARSSRLSI